MVHVFPEMDDTLCATHKRTAYIISEQAEPNQIHSTSKFIKCNQYKKQANKKLESSVGKDKWRIFIIYTEIFLVGIAAGKNEKKIG